MASNTEKKAFIECFSNFMSDSEGLAQEDLVAELKEQKIDIDQLKIDVAEIVKRGSEKRRLGWRRHAKQKMEGIEKLIGFTKTIPDAAINAKDKIVEFIKDAYGPGALHHAEAYFRNKVALSENDIKNLFEDLEQLESMEKSSSKQD